MTTLARSEAFEQHAPSVHSSPFVSFVPFCGHAVNRGLAALRAHWPEYLCEAALLGGFMVSACVFAIVLFHPDSSAAGAIESPLLRRALMGLAMGLTAVALIHSPPGQRSGAHMNPAVTLTFWRLGKVRSADAIFYIIAQFIGGVAGVLLARVLLPGPVAAAEVRYVATLPGPHGALAAWAGEFVIALLLMLVVLFASNHRALTRATGLLAGLLVMLYITFESPISGMSMNPARTFGSALWAGVWTHWWIYFTAPPLAMLAGAQVYVGLRGRRAVHCAKLHHVNGHWCIFRCEFDRLMAEPAPAESSPAANPPPPVRHQSEQTLYYG